MDGFEDFEIIHAYTRAQALEDGSLVDVTELAQEAGFKVPVALTRAVWEGCVAWTQDNGLQDETGRLWDVLNVAREAARWTRGSRNRFLVAVIPNEPGAEEAQNVRLTIDIGPGDDAEPVITIGYPQDF